MKIQNGNEMFFVHILDWCMAMDAVKKKKKNL